MIGLVWTLAFLLVTRERQKDGTVQQTIPWKTLFSLLWRPAVFFPILASFASYWYVALLISWVPVYYVQVWRLPQSSALYVLAIGLPWLMAGIMQVGIGWLSDRLFTRGGSRLRVSVLSITLLIGALLLVGAALAPSLPLAILCLSLTPLGASVSPHRRLAGRCDSYQLSRDVSRAGRRHRLPRRADRPGSHRPADPTRHFSQRRIPARLSRGSVFHCLL